MGTWFSHRNWVDAPDSILTASAEAGDLLVENLRNRYYYRQWRVDQLEIGSDDLWFEVDFGQVREVGCLVLLFPRFVAPNYYDVVPSIDPITDTIRHRLDAVTAGAGLLEDTGAISSGVNKNYGYHVVKLDEVVNARYWRCDISAPSRVTAGYINLVRAWAGPTIEPAVNFSFGANHGWSSDSTIQTASRGLTDFVDARESKRSFTMTFDWLNNSESDDFEELEQLMTTAGQFVVSREDLSSVKGTMFARQSRTTGLQVTGAHLRNQKSFQLVESL